MNSKIIASKVLDVLLEKRALADPQDSAVLFDVETWQERYAVAFDPDKIIIPRIDADFIHRLSTRLGGRLVVATNHQCVALQISAELPTALTLEIQPLDLTAQPSPYHLPIGHTSKGALWIALQDADSVLVAGSRGMGKSGFVHGCIQSLLNGGKVEVYADDGASALEFGRYVNSPRFHYMANVAQELDRLSNLLASRLEILRRSGFTNINTYNAANGGSDNLPPIALVVDEITLLDDELKEKIKRMVQFYRKCGLYPILATNEPLKAALLVKSNLVTRLCFPVPQKSDSQVVIGYSGAEALPRTQPGQPGRGLMVWQGKLMEFQAFRVPNIGRDVALTEEQKSSLGAIFGGTNGPQAQPEKADPIAELAESIRSQWNKDMSGNRTAALLGKPYGGSWKAKIDQVIAYLTSTTSTTTEAA
jgi:hypothetical protein